MKRNGNNNQGSVLMTVILTVSILTMICATSLYIAGQNANAGAQAASWQQGLGGAESAVDQAIAALNTGTWTNWVTMSGSVPNLQPSPGTNPTAATAPPDSTHFNYLAASITPQTAGYQVAGSLTTSNEGNPAVSMWATLDTGGLPVDGNGHQWYRVRATGTASTAGPVRVSNQSLDTDLRKISLRFDRRSSTALSSPQATRSVEVIVQALAQSIWVRGITLKSTITMSGGGTIDSFNSSDPFKSTNGLYDVSKRQSHGDVGTFNASGSSNLGSTYVYGGLVYSGAAVKNTTHVQGTISTPFNASVPATSNPNWAAGSWNAAVPQVNGTATLTAGTQASPARYKLSQINLSGNNVLTLAANGGGTDGYMEIWVTGKMTTSGNGYISQASSVHVTYYVDDDISVSGNGYDNQSGEAANVVINGVGTGQTATVSGNGVFIGVLNAPGYAISVTGNGAFDGALIGNTLTISGGASFHYDEALNTNTTDPSIGNYAFASWFEDTR
jgi:hypothetical protein